LSLSATNSWIPSQVRLARDFEYERPKDRPANIFDDWEVFNPELKEVVKQPKAARQAAARFWWSKAKAGLPKLNNDAARDDARAIYALGLLHESGDLVESNAVLAAEMFQMAAKSGLAPAQEKWANHCRWNLTNNVEAANWYYQAATQGLMNAQSSLSYLDSEPSAWHFDPYFQPKACERVRWTFELASQPIACFQTYWACGELGELYFSGLGVESNAVEAVKWYRRAIGLGTLSNGGWAELNLALHYYNGNGVAKDYAEAAELFRKAAEQNNAPAQNYIGICYYNGNGVPKDYAEAVKWYRKAAEQNNDAAQYNLGNCYRGGLGVEKDYVEAYKWENLAAASKDEQIAKGAVECRRWLESQMSPEQIAKAQRLSHGDLLDQVAAASQQNPSTPAESKSRFDWDYWGLVAICVTFAVLLITLAVLIFSSLVRYVRRMKISVSKLIILVGAVAFILCGLFPPWLDISHQGHTRSAGYSFILSPPPGDYGVKLDIARLFVEWFCIAVATGTVWLLVSKPEKGKDSKDN
jgi:TPR repeat protein